jgi:hypothetical protein
MTILVEGWPIEEAPLGDGWASVAALATDRFDMAEEYFAAAVASEPGLDRRGQGAYFMGGVSFYFAFALAFAVLRDKPLPNLTPHSFGIQRDGNLLNYRIAPGSGMSPVRAGALIEEAHAPLIARVREATRLSDAAQWRIIADGIASAFLYAGQHLEREAQGRKLGLEIVRDPTYRFFNGHTDYIEVEGKCFLKRGGCCRYYTADAGSFCATCILRPADEHAGEIRRRYFETEPELKAAEA